MIRVAAVTIIALDFPEMILIADVAFDCALILFGIGLLRLGSNIDAYKNWKIAPIMLFSSAMLDLINVIITATSFRESWTTEPLVYINLTILICQALVLIIGFLFVKLNIDSLAKNELIERKGQYLLSLGFIVNLAPSIFGWYGEFVGETAYQLWQRNLAFYLYLFATFLILLGFLGLASTMKLLQIWSQNEDLEIVPDHKEEEVI